jgi:hypothetical protein
VRVIDPEEAAREARRKARATWPGGKYRLGEEPPDDVSHMSPDERVAAVWRITLSAWLLAGNELPNLPRSQWPGTIIRAT